MMSNIDELLKSAGSKLSEKISIYVPSTANVNNHIDNTKQVKKVAEKLSAWFGGATANNSNGFWVSENCGLVEEDITIIYSNTTKEALNIHGDDVLKLVKELKEELKQEAISIEINNELYII